MDNMLIKKPAKPKKKVVKPKKKVVKMPKMLKMKK